MSWGWKLFLALSLLAGIGLRTLHVRDMEYKEDEQYNYAQSQLIGNTEAWPAYGIASGVNLVNPGMSIWVFAALAKITNSRTPTELAHSVQGFALLGICLVLLFSLTGLIPTAQKEAWYWAFALAMVNPIAILYQRKLWPEPFLPVFTLIFLAGWFLRRTRWGSFLWGLIGALIGQIHMSGFFFAAGFFLWTLIFSEPKDRKDTQWKFWFLGSILGSLSLLPWLHYLLTHPTATSLEKGWGEAVQLKYWVFWMSGAFGLHLGNTLGVYIGDSQWLQLSDFVRYPLIASHSTYLVGLAHLGVFAVMIWSVLQLIRLFKGELGFSVIRLKNQWIGRESETAFAQNAAFWGAGILMEITNLNIRRYYLCVVFPFEFLWLSRLALRHPNRETSRRWLAFLWLCQLLISCAFVNYIHVNHGSPRGDYGDAYHVVIGKQKL